MYISPAATYHSYLPYSAYKRLLTTQSCSFFFCCPCCLIGTDSLGDEYLAQLLAEGVETKYMRRSTDGKSTGIAVINVETSTGANTIVVIPGANDDLSITDDADQDLIQHLQNANVLITQNEIPRMTTLKALQLAQSAPQTVSIFNPAPVSDGLAELIAVSDIVIPNETELAALTSLPTTTDVEIETAAQKLLSMGCRCCIATLGENGAFVIVNDGSAGMFLRTTSVKAVDSTGAGDSFIGTLASNLARGSSLVQSVKNALHCASISVTRAGAQKSYARLEEIDEKYRPLIWTSTNPPFSKKSIFRL